MRRPRASAEPARKVIGNRDMQRRQLCRVLGCSQPKAETFCDGLLPHYPYQQRLISLVGANVLGRFSMAGFEVIIYGLFSVIAEASSSVLRYQAPTKCPSLVIRRDWYFGKRRLAVDRMGIQLASWGGANGHGNQQSPSIFASARSV
jgi:hypothetical protein